FDCRARLDYGTNPLCASERSESNFQFRTTVDSSAMFPPRAYFCDYPNNLQNSTFDLSVF
ncbi:MAG: hypothetical protein J6I53_00250, partial [Treponema sp.]|nr:hypothetical protein [Treponema sp.]